MHPRLARSLITASAALTALTLLTACGKSIQITDDDDEQPAEETSAPASGEGNAGLEVVDNSAADSGMDGDGGTVTGDAPQQTPPRWAQLTAARGGAVEGARLVDVNQSSLYRFDNDSADPSRTTCYDQCAETWPPVTVQEGGSIYLQHVSSEVVGAIRRDDGQIQLTVGGWPVYRFSGDDEPGELNGQGSNGTWFAVSPEGRKVQ